MPEGTPLSDWLLEHLDRDLSSWDRLGALAAPLSGRLAFSLRLGEVVILESAAAHSRPVDPSTRNGDGSISLRPYLSQRAGGRLFPVLTPFLPGAEELALEVLGEPGAPLQLPAAAIRIIAAASRDPALYEWTRPEAHAMSRSLPGGIEPLHPEAGQRCFHRWLLLRLERAEAACRRGDGRFVLYHLGTALHAVMDLGVHRGMTLAEHAHLAMRGEDPDADPEGVRRAAALLRGFLREVVPPFLGECLRRAQAMEQALLRPLSTTAIMEQLGATRDLTRDAYRGYRRLGRLFTQRLEAAPPDERERSRAALHVEWFADGESGRALASLVREVLPRQPLSSEGCTPE